MIKKIRLFILLLFICIALLVGGTFAAAFGMDPKKLENTNGPTIIKDASGNTVMEIKPDNSNITPLNQIPLNMQHAVISVEDSRFYQTQGIDMRALFRALFVDILSGSEAQGASNITEQLAKVAYLSNDKTISRKIKQIFYGLAIEKTYSKDQILDFYLNKIYLGHGATGVEEAARVYFNEPVSQLTLAQSALLAALPKAPSYYDPYVHPSDALTRRNLVLQKMLEQKYITNEQYQTAVHEPIQLTHGVIVKDDVPEAYQYYRDYLYEEVEKLGISPSSISEGGMTIYTSLNPQLQKAAYRMYQNPDYFPDNMSGDMAQSGAVFMDPKTGGIEALIGGRGTYVNRGLDHATQIHRSPGSSIKPLVVYGPAIETGNYNRNSMLYDGDLNINGYQPHDWDRNTRGEVTLQNALDESWNIPAVYLLQKIGIDKGIAFAQKAGLTFTQNDHNHLGVALGDIENGTNPMEMADAYSTFDNGGERIPAHAITKIVDSNNNMVYSADISPVQVTDQATADTMTKLLKHVVDDGIAQSAQVSNWDVAGKTGSTEYGSEDKDVWFCGYTPTVVGSIWMGFDNTDNHHYIPNSSGGSRLPARLFSAILSEGLSGNGQSFNHSDSGNYSNSDSNQDQTPTTEQQVPVQQEPVQPTPAQSNNQNDTANQNGTVTDPSAPDTQSKQNNNQNNTANQNQNQNGAVISPPVLGTQPTQTNGNGSVQNPNSRTPTDSTQPSTSSSGTVNNPGMDSSPTRVSPDPTSSAPTTTGNQISPLTKKSQ